MITKRIFSVLACFAVVGMAAGQPSICQKIYVWPFVDQSGQNKELAATITGEVETALTRNSGCIVLQRRNFASLTAQAQNEAAIRSLAGVPAQVGKELETMEAEVVLFGTVEKDFSGNVNLKLSFENLLTKQILRRADILMNAQDANDIVRRNGRIERLVTNCINPAAFDEEQDWEEARNINTVESYQRYVAKYPQGNYRSLAEKQIEEEQVWRSIEQEEKDNERINMLKQYRQKQYTRHEKEANAMLGELLWQKGRTGEYLKYFPDGPYAEQAREKEDRKGQLVDGIAESISSVVQGELGKGKEGESAGADPASAADPFDNAFVFLRHIYSGKYLCSGEQNNGGKFWMWGPIPAGHEPAYTFRLSHVGENTYYLQHVLSGKYLCSGDQNNGGSFWMWGPIPAGHEPAYSFRFSKVSGDTYYLQHVLSGKYLCSGDQQDGGLFLMWGPIPAGHEARYSFAVTPAAAH